MFDTFIDRRATILRMNETTARLGRQFVKIDDHTVIRYNWDENIPSFHVELAKHAAHHNGRVLLPFNAVVNPTSIQLCSTFFLWITNDEYLEGRIHDAGENYRLGMNNEDGYTAPKSILLKESSRWVKLDDVQLKKGFPMEDYRLLSHDDKETLPLQDVIRNSRMSCMFIVRKDKEGE